MGHRRSVRCGIVGCVAAVILVTGGAPAIADPVTTTYGYDSLGRLIKVTRVIDSITYIVQYKYDAAGNRTATSTNGVTTGIWGSFQWGPTAMW